MKIETKENNILLSEVYNGIGIDTPNGIFGIAQRDGGIEILHNGHLVWSSNEGSPEMLHIKQFQKEVYDLAKEKGWHEEQNEKTFGECIALIHSELSESLEEYRAGCGYNEIYYENSSDKPEGINIEMADVFIRLLDTAQQFGIDLESAVKIKHEYNKTRSYRHGNKII